MAIEASTITSGTPTGSGGSAYGVRAINGAALDVDGRRVRTGSVAELPAGPITAAVASGD